MQSCLPANGCNVWVYCDNPNGCDNKSGQKFPLYTCTLKYQDAVASDSDNGPEIYGSFGTSDFSSGKVLTTGAVL